MKEIIKGEYRVLLDDKDYEWLHKSGTQLWVYKDKKVQKPYVAIYHKEQGHISLHRFLLGLKKGDGLCADHINSNGLDNRRKNLRTCTKLQNNWNARLRKDSTSGYRGVNLTSDGKSWAAVIGIRGQMKYLGCFKDKVAAAKAYNKAALKYRGEFAKLNPV